MEDWKMEDQIWGEVRRRKMEDPKLRTDGGYPRVRELASIDLFVVVTSLKMNQLPPNFEHKFPIMCGIVTANFFAV